MDFALILLVLTLISGIIVLIDRFFLKAKRQKKEPKLIEYSRAFFPVFLLVFLLRSFLIEPFRIPSGSLEPTLLVGDFVAVSKFSYGLRFPVLNIKLLSVGEPKVGDIVVFSWPPETKYDYIKRIIGTPGDKINYHDKILTINGQKAKQSFIENTMDSDGEGHAFTVEKRKEVLKDVTHDIYVRQDVPAFNFDITVPEGYYFAMGDNRDNSSDSRYWGFVPEANLKGRAFIVWMSWNGLADRVRWSRIGHFIH